MARKFAYAAITMYIHERDHWYNFVWDNDKVIPLLTSARHLQGKLLGRMENLGFDLIEKARLESLILDVVDSSRIEGEFLNPQEVRSSIARRLGIEDSEFVTSSRNVDGIVDILLDATQHYDEALTHDRLYGWHHALFQSGYSSNIKIDVGKFRSTGMKVVSGMTGREKAHFVAPPAENVSSEMEIFLNWLNNNQQFDLVLKAAIAHFWFVTIHPFDDGNGRLARAIMDMLLARSDNSTIRFYSMSNQIFKEHKKYNEIIEKCQKGSGDISLYLEWFLECFKRALLSSETHLKIILDKARFWDIHKFTSINQRQRDIINFLYDNFEKETGYFRTSDYSKIAHCSTDTALRDLQDLVKKHMFESEETGKKTNYVIVSPNKIRIPAIPAEKRRE